MPLALLLLALALVVPAALDAQTVTKRLAVTSDVAVRLMDIVGTALVYNQENALPTASFYTVGDTWTEDTPTFTQKTAPLRIMGRQAQPQ